jgi:ATP-dependent RNA helicase DDX55/SPB4
MNDEEREEEDKLQAMIETMKKKVAKAEAEDEEDEFTGFDD